VTGIVVVSVVVGAPALLFALWPLLRRDAGGRTFLPLPLDRRQQLGEDKRAVFAALRELEFEHAAGHVSDPDFTELRARYEGEAAAILGELDRFGASTPQPIRVEAAAPHGAAWRHPIALGTFAVLLVAFGVALGAGVVRYTEPDPMAGQPQTGSRPLAALPPEATLPPSSAAPPSSPGGRVVPPEVLRGMLQAARSSLAAGRYGEAIAAYQAVLKRDSKNVDAMTHLALIVAIGGGPEHADRALETFDKALAIDPSYLPALLYRGQLLYEVKKDMGGAIRSWETFVALAPPGEDRDRVVKMIADARAGR
jgi:tetratricopeptide (TPR) repeat protein